MQPLSAFRFPLLLLLLATSASAATIPPQQIREPNYGKSCGHASFVTVLRMHGMLEQADAWRASHRGPVAHQTIARAAKAAGLPVVATFSGDASFLDRHEGVVIDWMAEKRVRTRRGTGVEERMHAVVFCGYRSGVAVISDPNHTDKIQCYPRAGFLAYWRKSGGRAVGVAR